MRSLKISRHLPSSTTGSDPSYRDHWAWDKMELEAARDRFSEAMRGQPLTAESITVAIVDWGIQLDHQAFAQDRGMVSGASVISPAGDFSDDDGHGTMLAGTIGGMVDCICGRGAVPSVQLLAVKFIDVLTPPMSDNAAEAIEYAVKKGARIINASWDVGLNSPALRKSIKYAADNDVLVVAAAGNNGGNNSEYPTYPASLGLSNMISVMATDEDDEKPAFSNYGCDSVDIAAPGVNIVSTTPYLVRPSSGYNSAYRSYSGTSPAAAHVTGAAALLLLLHPIWKPQRIRDCLMGSVDDVPALHRYCRAGGRLNLRRAVGRALE